MQLSKRRSEIIPSEYIELYTARTLCTNGIKAGLLQSEKKNFKGQTKFEFDCGLSKFCFVILRIRLREWALGT